MTTHEAEMCWVVIRDRMWYETQNLQMLDPYSDPSLALYFLGAGRGGDVS